MLEDERKRKIQDGFRKVRKDRGLTQEDVGNALGKTKAHVSNLEGAQSLPPSIEDLILMARLFSVSTDHLLGLTQVPTPRTGELDEQTEQLLSRFGALSEHRRRELVEILDVIWKADRDEQQWRNAFRESVSVLRERGTAQEVARILEEVLATFD